METLQGSRSAFWKQAARCPCTGAACPGEVLLTRRQRPQADSKSSLNMNVDKPHLIETGLATAMSLSELHVCRRHVLFSPCPAKNLEHINDRLILGPLVITVEGSGNLGHCI